MLPILNKNVPVIGKFLKVKNSDKYERNFARQFFYSYRREFVFHSLETSVLEMKFYIFWQAHLHDSFND